MYAVVFEYVVEGRKCRKMQRCNATENKQPKYSDRRRSKSRRENTEEQKDRSRHPSEISTSYLPNSASPRQEEGYRSQTQQPIASSHYPCTIIATSHPLSAGSWRRWSTESSQARPRQRQGDGRAEKCSISVYPWPASLPRLVLLVLPTHHPIESSILPYYDSQPNPKTVPWKERRGVSSPIQQGKRVVLSPRRNSYSHL